MKRLTGQNIIMSLFSSRKDSTITCNRISNPKFKTNANYDHTSNLRKLETLDFTPTHSFSNNDVFLVWQHALNDAYSSN